MEKSIFDYLKEQKYFEGSMQGQVGFSDTYSYVNYKESEH